MSKEELNQTIHRPWGNYTSISGGDKDGYKVKKIIVYPKQRLSSQSHEYRSEHWVVSNGSAMAELNDKYIPLEKNDYLFIPKGAKHRIRNTGLDNLEFIETQIGDYLSEDDIVRYSDDYGRV